MGGSLPPDLKLIAFRSEKRCVFKLGDLDFLVAFNRVELHVLVVDDRIGGVAFGGCDNCSSRGNREGGEDHEGEDECEGSFHCVFSFR